MEQIFRAWDRELQREVVLLFLLDWGLRPTTFKVWGMILPGKGSERGDRR